MEPVNVVVIRLEARPWTLNSERRMHRMQRAEHARQWRSSFHLLALHNKVASFGDTPVIVVIQPHLAKGPMFDCDACHPAAKAAIDGLVDAGVLASDGPNHVTEVRYLRPLPAAKDDLTVLIFPRKAAETGQITDPSGYLTGV